MARLTLGILAADERAQIPANFSVLEPYYELKNHGDWRTAAPGALLEGCRGAQVLLTGRASPALPTELIQNMGQLRYLCHMFGTVKHLVTREHLQQGLLVTNWGDQVAGVAEGALALLLCQLKQLIPLSRLSQGSPDDRIWTMFPATLRGRDVGLYGFGPIGQHMERMLRPLGANVAIYDPFAQHLPEGVRRCESLRELFATCQIVSIHCGLNDATRDSVTAELLALLPDGGIVINTARGSIVDESALAADVSAGRLLAGCDVIRDERNWSGSPLTPLSGAVLTKHSIGGGKGYPPGKAPPPKLPDHTLANLLAYARGEALEHVITLEQYDLKT